VQKKGTIHNKHVNAYALRWAYGTKKKKRIFIVPERRDDKYEVVFCKSLALSKRWPQLSKSHFISFSDSSLQFSGQFLFHISLSNNPRIPIVFLSDIRTLFALEILFVLPRTWAHMARTERCWTENEEFHARSLKTCSWDSRYTSPDSVLYASLHAKAGKKEKIHSATSVWNSWDLYHRRAENRVRPAYRKICVVICSNRDCKFFLTPWSRRISRFPLV